VNYSDIVAGAAADVEPRLTSILRRNARNAGWSGESILSLSVRSEGTDLYVEASSEAAMDQEYGTIDRRPSPVVREFIARPEVTEAEIMRAVENRLGGAL
jgi:hypothetical protein